MSNKNDMRKNPDAQPAHTSPPDAPDWPQGELRPLPELAYGVLDELLGYALRRAQNALYLHFQRSVGRADVSPQRFAALVLVAHNPGLRQGLLAQAMGLHRSGALRLVDWLCAQGWVRRADDAQDRRSWTIYPTPQGLAVLGEVSARVRAHDQTLLTALGPDGAALPDLLGRLATVAAQGDAAHTAGEIGVAG